MRLPRQRIVISSASWPLAFVAMLLCCGSLLAAEPLRGAIVCREDVPLTSRVELAHQLQAITGWQDLNFDSNGMIRLESRSVSGGSAAARSLLAQTLANDKVLILEAANDRADVVFARVVPGRWKGKSAEGRRTFVVLIDFADFGRLMGDRPALAAFNVGWSLLHEIDHVVNDSVDSEVPGHAGECEDHINQMRRECHLPIRMDYFFRYFAGSDKSDFRTRLVRLAFEPPADNKQRRFWVIWDAKLVGELDSASQVALK